MNPNDDLVAAFLARGGTIRVVPEGTTNGMTTKDWQMAVRGETPVRTQADDDFEVENRAERFREAVNDAYMAGGSTARDEVMAEGY